MLSVEPLPARLKNPAFTARYCPCLAPDVRGSTGSGVEGPTQRWPACCPAACAPAHAACACHAMPLCPPLHVSTHRAVVSSIGLVRESVGRPCGLTLVMRIMMLCLERRPGGVLCCAVVPFLRPFGDNALDLRHLSSQWLWLQPADAAVRGSGGSTGVLEALLSRHLVQAL